MLVNNINFNAVKGKTKIPDQKWKDLLDHFNQPQFVLVNDNFEFPDLLGAAYEYLIKFFADSAGKKGGEFYTPAEVVRLLVQLTKPEAGNEIYDPTAGSGGFLIQAHQYVEEQGQDANDLALYGQDSNGTVWSICNMNMILHNITRFTIENGDTLEDPQILENGQVRKFDRVLANPPFSQNYSRAGMKFTSRFREWCPETGKKADLMFVQHMLASLNPNGHMATIMPHGVLFRSGKEKLIRELFINDDLIEAIISLPPGLFYGTGIPACVLVCNKNKPDELRNKVLFVNADREYAEGKNQNKLRPEDIEKIDFVFTRKRELPKYSRLVEKSEIVDAHDYNLNIRRYVDNTPEPEPEDVQAHLIGGIPENEVAARGVEFAKFGVNPTTLFEPERPGYLAFRKQIGAKPAIKTTLEADPALQQVIASHHAVLEVWWTLARDDFAQLRDGKKMPDVRHELLTTLKGIPEAIDQLLRYSEQRGANGEGSAPLFFYNQFVVVTCRQEAKFGTITTHSEKYFYRWADPYPRTVDDLEHGAGAPNDQQRLVAGMLDCDNLLDLIRTFTLFSTNDKGETIRIVGRYQQFRAVKLAVKRLLEGKNPRERSGIIWHTQGSGKSLTMMFMVREMYRHAQLSNWKVVFVTDRTQLEGQLSETSQSIGFTVKVADSIRRLKELLRADTSDLVMAMIHKFREADLTESFPELNTSPNILVMTDEAHRSQYKLLGANLDKGIPNAAKIGYTGTPIDKTEQVFGDYIDKYTMRQSIEDGVTLEIVYEGRTHNAEVPDQAGMDAAFADVFSDYNLQQRLEILGYGSRDAYLEAEPTIEAKAKDMVAHYLTHVYPNGYKGQVVATSREAAVRYKKHIDAALAAALAEREKSNPRKLDLDQLKAMKTDVIISGSHNDLPHLKAFSDSSKHETSIKSFKMAFGGKEDGVTGDMGILIVNNMLLTGFDAPVEQVMYLDKVVVAHNLLQAIARVNRVGGESKDKGFVVDYVGVGHHLKKAIDTYDEREQQEVIDALSFPEEELRELKDSHAAIMAFLKAHSLKDLTDHDAFFDVFYDEDLRFDFMLAFKKLTKCLNLVFPAKQALDYMPDYQGLTEMNVLAGKHFRDERLSMKGIPPKLRAITDTYLESRGIHVKVPPISILDEDFEKNVGTRRRTKTKAAEVEHAIRHHLDVELDDDPELQASFAQALAAIFAQFRENWNQIYDELEKLRARIISASKEPTYGLHRKKQMPLFRMFQRELFGESEVIGDTGATKASDATLPYGISEEDRISHLVDLTQKVFLVVERELKLTGFWESIPARNKLKAEIQNTLLAPEFSPLPGLVQKRAHIISRIMEIAEKNNDVILYAE